MRLLHVFALVLGTVLLSACGGDDSTEPSAVTTTFQGTVAGTAGQTGTLTVTVQTQVAAVTPPFFRVPGLAILDAETVSATGSVRIVGFHETVTLTGTYDTTTKKLNLSGGGFTFSGAIDNGVVTGTYSGTGTSGSFSCRSTASGIVTVYCGNVFGAPPSTSVVTGVFNLVVTNSTGGVSGAFVVSPNSGYITGQLTGTALAITYTDPVAGQSGTATGTIQNGVVSGVSVTSNPFSGSTSACQ